LIEAWMGRHEVLTQARWRRGVGIERASDYRWHVGLDCLILAGEDWDEILRGCQAQATRDGCACAPAATTPATGFATGGGGRVEDTAESRRQVVGSGLTGREVPTRVQGQLL